MLPFGIKIDTLPVTSDDLGKFEYLRLCKNELLDEYKQKHEGFSCNLTTTRLFTTLQNISAN